MNYSIGVPVLVLSLKNSIFARSAKESFTEQDLQGCERRQLMARWHLLILADLEHIRGTNMILQAIFLKDI